MSAYDVIHSFYVMGSCFANNFFQNGSPPSLSESILFVIPDLIRDPVFYIDRLVGCAEFFKKFLQSSTWIQSLFFEYTYWRSLQQGGGGVDGMRSSQQPL